MHQNGRSMLTSITDAMHGYALFYNNASSSMSVRGNVSKLGYPSIYKPTVGRTHS